MERSGASRGEMPFLDHLEELRWRVFKSALALVAAVGIGLWLILEFDVLTILTAPALPYLPGGKLNVLDPMTPFFFTLKTSLLFGLIFAFPILLYQLWAFLSPALEAAEKRMVVPALYLGLALFMLGVDLAYRYALPVSLDFLFGIQTEVLQPMLAADEYLSFVIRLLLAFGIIFEVPVVILILSTMGLVTPSFLRSKRRHAVVGITVLASLLSPGDVIMVTVMMMVPLFLLYEFSILLSVLVYREKRKEEAKRSIGDPALAGPPPGTVGRDDLDPDDDPDDSPPEGDGPDSAPPAPPSAPPPSRRSAPHAPPDFDHGDPDPEGER